MPGLLLPRHANPSYKSGYARSSAESANPGLWDGLTGAWVPQLGQIGLVLQDMSGQGHHGAMVNMEATDWLREGGVLGLNYDGSAVNPPPTTPPTETHA